MAKALAEAFVRVRPDTKGFAKETEGQTSELESGFKKLGGVIAGVFVADKLIEWGKSAVEAFFGAEKAQLALQTAFEKFPRLADTNVQSLEQLDAALGKKTTFDRYAIESGQAVLAQFRVTGTQVKELTPLMLDYAAKTGQDVPSAAQALGKALLGNGRALKSIGIQFKDTGNATGNYNELVAALRGQVGGFAEKEGRSAEGQLKIMENRFHDLEVEVGGKLVPILSTAVSVVLAVTSAIASGVGWLDKHRAAVIGLAAAIGVLLIPKMIELAAEFSSDAVQVFVKGLNAASKAAKGAGSANVALLATFGPIAAVAGVAGFLVVKSWQSQQKAILAGKKEADDYYASILQIPTSLASITSATSLLTLKFNEQAVVVGNLIKQGDFTSNNWSKQAAALSEYQAKLTEQEATQKRVTDNEIALGKQYHLTREQVEQLATTANIDLGGALDVVSKAFWDQLKVVDATHHPLTQIQKDFAKVADKSLSAADQVNALKTAFDELIGKGLSADQAAIAFADDIADLTAALKASHGAMDLTTQSGRDARKQFDRTAQAALDLAAAQKDAGASNTVVKNTLDKAINSLERAGGKNAYVRSEVAKLRAAEADLKAAVDATNTSLSKVPNNPYHGVTVPGARGTYRFAAGGPVIGPGTKTSDSIDAKLSTGEFVFDAMTVDRIGVPLLNYLNNGGSLGSTALRAPVASQSTDAAPQADYRWVKQLLAELRELRADVRADGSRVASALNGVAMSAAHQGR